MDPLDSECQEFGPILLRLLRWTDYLLQAEQGQKKLRDREKARWIRWLHQSDEILERQRLGLFLINAGSHPQQGGAHGKMACLT